MMVVDDLLEVLLLDKFNAALNALELANGTSLAAALASAIMVDLRQSRNEDGVEIIDALDDDAIIDLGADLLAALEHKHQRFMLPLGAEVRSDQPGSVRIGAETWVTRAGQAGLFPLETMRRDAHGPNLELLRDTISEAVRNKPWRQIGLPSPVLIVDSDARHLLKFPPFGEAGGVVLQRWASETGASRFSAATPAQIEALAASIVADMEVLWRRRSAVAIQVEAVRAIAEAKIPRDAVGVAIHAIAIDFECQRDDERFCFYLEYDAIDEAMRPGVVLDYIPAIIDGQFRRDPVPHGIDGRRAERDELRALGADGEIDPLAAAVVRFAPEGQAEVLSRLAASYETSVTFMAEAGPVYATLFWRDGCIKTEIVAPGIFEQSGNILRWYDQEFSQDDVDALVGGSLSSRFTLPFDDDCKIISATTLMSRGVELRFDRKRSLVNCGTGSIWER